MLATLVRDTLRRVPEGQRVPELDARVQAYRRLLDRLLHEVQAARVGGVAPRVSGMELVLLEGVEILEEVRRAPGYEGVVAVVGGLLSGLALSAEEPGDGG